MTQGIISDVPNQPKTPLRSLRVSEQEWESWKWAAEKEGMTLADFVRDAANNRVKRVIRKHQE